MSKARAAEIWAQLERFLIERCGLPDGRMLDRDRPQLIRSIGKALGGGELLEEKTQRQSQKERQSQSESRRQVRPAIRLGETRRSRVSPGLKPERLGSSATRITRTVHGGGTAIAADTIHDPAWAAMLERSCSRRMGYDGDDEVSYGPR